MIRNDKSKFLLFMEPNNPPTKPINDHVTKFMQMAFDEAISGTSNYSDLKDNGDKFHTGSGYKGIHVCRCGETGGSKDYKLKNGMITNWLCVHYVDCHRDEISDNDIIKLQQLIDWYEKQGN